MDADVGALDMSLELDWTPLDRLEAVEVPLIERGDDRALAADRLVDDPLVLGGKGADELGIVDDERLRHRDAVLGDELCLVGLREVRTPLTVGRHSDGSSPRPRDA